MDSGLYICGNSTSDSAAREAWVEERVEYHRTHWRKFKEMYVEYFAGVAAASTNEGSTLDDSGTGWILDYNLRHHCAQITHVLWHFG